MLKEFKEFAIRGNVVDMAVGVIIGAAFGKIVSSMVSDVLMPPLGLALGKVDFTSLFVSLSGESFPSLAAAKAAGAPTLNYGVFLQHSFDFIILAFVVFLLVRQVNRLRPKAPEEAPKTRECPQCLSDIPKRATRSRTAPPRSARSSLDLERRAQLGAQRGYARAHRCVVVAPPPRRNHTTPLPSAAKPTPPYTIAGAGSISVAGCTTVALARTADAAIITTSKVMRPTPITARMSGPTRPRVVLGGAT